MRPKSRSNSYRVGDAYTEPNFGLIEIDWAATPEPRVTLSVNRIDGQLAISHAVSLAALK